MKKHQPESWFEDELQAIGRREGRRVLAAWANQCRMLTDAGLRSPAEVPAWVSALGRRSMRDADDVMRFFVERLQAGDGHAGAVVMVCLVPGLKAMAKATGVALDEVVAEAALVAMRMPTRRHRVFAGLLLDTRHQFWMQRHRRPQEVPAGNWLDELRQRATDAIVGRSSADELVAVLRAAYEAGRLTEDEVRLIAETRLFGDLVRMAGRRRGLCQKTTFARRHRAESLLTADLVDPPD